MFYLRVFSIGIHWNWKRKHYCSFSWSGNDTVLVCKLYVNSVNKYFYFGEFDNISIDRFLLVAVVKYILSQIYSHCIQNCTFWYFMEIVEFFVFWRRYFQSLLIFMFFYPKNTTSMTQEKLVAESYMTPQWIIFSMFYCLIYNIHSHLNHLILACSVLLQ